MSPYSYWDASSYGCKNNSLCKISGPVSKWITEDSRLENSRYPSEWVTGGGLPCTTSNEVALDRWRQSHTRHQKDINGNVLTFAIPNAMRLLLWRLKFFFVRSQTTSILYVFENNLNPLSHRVVLGRKCNFLGIWFFDIRGSPAKNDTCFATIHSRALKNSFETAQ